MVGEGWGMVGEGWAQVLSRLQGLLWQSSSFQKRNVIYPFSIYIFATYYVQGTLTRNRKSHNRFNCMLPPPGHMLSQLQISLCAGTFS